MQLNHEEVVIGCADGTFFWGVFFDLGADAIKFFYANSHIHKKRAPEFIPAKFW